MNLIKRVTRGAFSKSIVPGSREKYLAMNKDEKRKFYKCRENFISLNEIKTWPEYYQEYEIKEKQKSKFIDIKEIPDNDLNSKLGVFIGDITCLEIDCIVNAANKTLLGGGGVDGAIHKAAGPMLLSECETLNGCETSQAKITAGYNLPAKYIIHTVGPIGYNPEALKTAYLNCLELAIENKCRSIAFPCISTGIYGFPNDKASMIVSKTLREYLEKNHEKFDRIILCLFLEKDIKLYEKFLNLYFPINQNQLFEEIKEKQPNSNASSNINEIKSENENENQTETANESKNENKSENEKVTVEPRFN